MRRSPPSSLIPSSRASTPRFPAHPPPFSSPSSVDEICEKPTPTTMQHRLGRIRRGVPAGRDLSAEPWHCAVRASNAPPLPDCPATPKVSDPTGFELTARQNGANPSVTFSNSAWQASNSVFEANQRASTSGLTARKDGGGFGPPCAQKGRCDRQADRWGRTVQRMRAGKNQPRPSYCLMANICREK